MLKFGSARLGSVGFVSEPFEIGSGDAGEELGSKGVSFVESDIESKVVKRKVLVCQPEVL